MPIGGNNPCSFRVGGGPTRTQQAYEALKSAVGVATEKAHESARDAMARMTGGINIPGLSDILGNMQR